jgi:hypothetical protein
MEEAVANVDAMGVDVVNAEAQALAIAQVNDEVLDVENVNAEVPDVLLAAIRNGIVSERTRACYLKENFWIFVLVFSK